MIVHPQLSRRLRKQPNVDHDAPEACAPPTRRDAFVARVHKVLDPHNLDVIIRLHGNQALRELCRVLEDDALPRAVEEARHVAAVAHQDLAKAPLDTLERRKLHVLSHCRIVHCVLPEHKASRLGGEASVGPKRKRPDLGDQERVHDARLAVKRIQAPHVPLLSIKLLNCVLHPLVKRSAVRMKRRATWRPR
eukprot:CAMPEP_0206266864 /NCGR_PEP_ID=MMETSP0047_2-20121206/30825_1 /ASSEMBLY_ACC=CAM_ASM_000192 /TAXON_ID=195065 /ORGANISM="Chroomonas mesostigmatica_cf, Strain CCMP1168" /LENGTH=191 /DNA_ID=CAMNT_0053694993 /DNA_START=164 /DNA_END=736 /DNA_ORIENTATION=+